MSIGSLSRPGNYAWIEERENCGVENHGTQCMLHVPSLRLSSKRGHQISSRKKKIDMQFLVKKGLFAFLANEENKTLSFAFMEGQCGIEFGVLNHSLAVELVRVRLEK